MKIHEHGYWLNETNEGHGHDEGLGKALVSFFKSEKTQDVLDVGCGDGYYLNLLNNNDIVCFGVDGNPNTPNLVGKACYVADLTDPFYLGGTVDWVLSLEVGEHIPATFEHTFLHTLDVNNKKGIVLSWAIRGQGGDGHVNCLDNYEVVNKIEPMGYKWDIENTMKLRINCAEYPNTGWWFRNTILVFRRVK